MRRPLLPLLLVPLLLGLAACAGDGGTRLAETGRYEPGHGPSALSRAPHAIVRVLPILDAPGIDPGLIGVLRGADGRIEQRYVLDPPPGRQFTDAIGAELHAAGHRLGGPGSPVTIEGGVQKFAFNGGPDSATWDWRIGAQLALTIRAYGRTLTRAYVATCNDAGVMRPSPAAVGGIAAACIAEIMRQFRDDPLVGAALSGR